MILLGGYSHFNAATEVVDIMKRNVNTISQESFSKKLYIATANQGEANYDRNKKRHDDFWKLIMQKSKNKSNLGIKYYKNENHRSIPLMALCDGLEYLNLKE